MCFCHDEEDGFDEDDEGRRIAEEEAYAEVLADEEAEEWRSIQAAENAPDDDFYDGPDDGPDDDEYDDEYDCW